MLTPHGLRTPSWPRRAQTVAGSSGHLAPSVEQTDQARTGDPILTAHVPAVLAVMDTIAPESRLIGGGLNRCFRGRDSRVDARHSGSRSWDSHENARVDESDSTQFQSLTCSRLCASSTSPLQALRLSSRFGRVARPRATWRRAFRSTTWRLTRADMPSPRLSPDVKKRSCDLERPATCGLFNAVFYDACFPAIPHLPRCARSVKSTPELERHLDGLLV